MRTFLAALVAALLLAACGTTAQQIETQQQGTVIDREPVPDGCHIALSLGEGEVSLAPSAECATNEVILAEIVDEDGLRVYDGGVIGGGPATHWPVRPGVYRLQERGGGDLIATITSP